MYMLLYHLFLELFFFIRRELSLAFPSRYIRASTHRDKQFLFIFTDRSAIGQRLSTCHNSIRKLQRKITILCSVQNQISTLLSDSSRVAQSIFFIARLQIEKLLGFYYFLRFVAGSNHPSEPAPLLPPH